ncbi:PD-(D/E)XK motif protein [Acinetobacter radioresistens]|uniref:PD-(D/E)XK motif protein n=1 Tax=Acinetobacter radioresistens TaxID=40216 RepID=UPI0020303FD3|nr:PD-(D/E)XK motif protein [Acinetobacter radioresistens]MCM1933975.1 PD-(D/E)XK motif protein [Acinetobacter radioresistens]MCM1951599.1 PD-(D/E)XK motif protein [Acinetobacter radioresistens]MCU4309827.1 PD-(D/E)XK motif protein [Acinetobacter radioresistens]MCU4565639.1 PD-(D/E)XK motif protein [Acinetobacter radioresistens]MCX0344320.1 PD-(D/E)XK motif protein [Acinetobacter radioresistens]
MNRNFAWDELSISAENSFTTRRIAEELCGDIYIARDNDSAFCVLIQHSEDLRKLFLKHRVDLRAIHLDYRHLETGKSIYTLLLKLKDDELLDYFDQFIWFVLQGLKHCKNEKDLVGGVLAKLKIWKKFLSSSREGKLTEEQIRGLLAEMYLLDQLLDQFPHDYEKILQGWYGPQRLHHDFLYKDLAIEVKSVSSTDKRHVRISSLSQLDSTVSRLFLSIYAVIKSPENLREKVNLNTLFQRIMAKLDFHERDVFEHKLIECNYIPDSYYDNYNYIVRLINFYEVKDGFPKLDSSLIPLGILNVTYDLDLNIIDSYKYENLFTDVGNAL